MLITCALRFSLVSFFFVWEFSFRLFAMFFHLDSILRLTNLFRFVLCWASDSRFYFLFLYFFIDLFRFLCVHYVTVRFSSIRFNSCCFGPCIFRFRFRYVSFRVDSLLFVMSVEKSAGQGSERCLSGRVQRC